MSSLLFVSSACDGLTFLYFSQADEERAWVIDLKHSLFSNVCIQGYPCPLSSQLYLDLHILICHISTFIQCRLSLSLPLWSITVREHTLCDFKLVCICFGVQDVVYIGGVGGRLERMCMLLVMGNLCQLDPVI